MVCEIGVGTWRGGGGVGRALVDKGPLPRVMRRRWEDRGRRRRVSKRFTTWTLSPAISVNAFSFLLYRSIVLVEFVAFLLGVFNSFRCDGAFWLVAGFVRYLTGKTFALVCGCICRTSFIQGFSLGK